MAHEDNELLLHGYFDGELDLIRSVISSNSSEWQ
jgi:hypothetical protein